MNCSHAQSALLEQLKKKIEEKLGNDFKSMKKEFTDENISLKRKIEQMEKEAQNLTGKIEQMEKEVQ